MKLIAASFILVLVTLASCDSQSTTDEQFRQYFGLPEFGEITPESARSALLKKFPVETPPKEVSMVLERSGIGKDKLNAYYPLDEKGRIICRIYRGSKNFVDERYIVSFYFDENRKLKNIEVKESLTGL